MQADVMHPDLFLGESPILGETRRPLEVQMPDGGHAATPGSGPIGRTCGDCENHFIHYDRAGRGFPKCWLLNPDFSARTDISLDDVACSCFERLFSTSALDARTLEDILEGR
jgi:hypothetical protein